MATPCGDDEWLTDGLYKEENNDEHSNSNILSRFVMFIQTSGKNRYMIVQKVTRGYFVTLVCLVAYIAYFIAAMCYKFGDEGSHRLVACTVLAVVIKARHKIVDVCKKIFRRSYGATKLTSRDESRLAAFRFFARWILYSCLAALIIWKLIDEAREKPSNLRSLPGLLVFNLIPIFFSTRPSKINWHILYWSNGLQFLCALIFLKWKFGRDSITWVQGRFDNYFASSNEASLFVFGPTYTDHSLVFNGFPILFFSGATLAIMYYLGIMQLVINAIGIFFKFVLSTSAIESTAVSLGIFTEGATTIMMLKPFLLTVTKSELFTIITSCSTSLGAPYVAILASMGVPLEYILPSMIISAPACFTVCKVIIPETRDKEDVTETDKILVHEQKYTVMSSGGFRRYSNILDALQTGTVGAISVVANLVAIIFMFMSMITWINSTLTWFGDRVGVDNLTIEFMSSYILYPVSLAMGVESLDCRRVALLLGYRICFSNIFAFVKLTEMTANKNQFMLYMTMTNGTGPVSHHDMDINLDLWNTTLHYGFLTNRSEAILIYCLCGFSSFMAVGLHMGVLCLMVPERKGWITKIMVPAMIAANIANCMTGCYASIFY